MTARQVGGGAQFRVAERTAPIAASSSQSGWPSRLGGKLTFVEYSRRLAKHLFSVQTGVNSPGLLCVGAGMRIERVLATDQVADVAFVEVPRELEDRGLELGPCEVAEDVWLLGFPAGWQGNVPLVSRGTIAGVAGSSAWVDGSASWGHSGGPVVALREQPVVVGDISGAASRVHRELEDLIRVAAEEQDLVERRIGQLSAQGKNVDPALGLAGHATTRVRQALQLIQSHFRAGFIEVATSEAITAFRGT